MEWTNESADAAAKADLKAAEAKFETKPCTRCDGAGYAHVLAPGRGHWAGSGASKVCYGCWGSGRVIAKKADRAAFEKLSAQIEVVRLRRRWLVAREVLRAAEAKVAAGADGWAAKFAVKDAARNLAALESMGKRAAAKAA